MPEWHVFPLAISRAKPVINATDIKDAIKDFTASTGRAPKFIALNKKNAGLCPDGLEVRTPGGCLLYEIWLAAEDPTLYPGSGNFTPSLPQGHSPVACDTALPMVEYPPAVVTTDILTQKIQKMAQDGKSCRIIEKELAAAGVTMSYRTIARRLQPRLAI